MSEEDLQELKDLLTAACVEERLGIKDPFIKSVSTVAPLLLKILRRGAMLTEMNRNSPVETFAGMSGETAIRRYGPATYTLTIETLA